MHRTAWATRWQVRCVDTAQVNGVIVLGVELPRIQDDVRHARDAESAHLEAALKIDGAKYLRLARLHEVLRERGFNDVEHFELKMIPGTEPQLWLGLSHCVTMEPDSGTYRLSSHGVDKIETALETTSLDEITAATAKLLAQGIVRKSRAAPAAIQNDNITVSNHATLVYVWLTGVVTGVAALTLYAIIMKRLPF